MITVTNRIHVKKGMGMKMAPAFVQPGPLQQFEGFHKVEVTVSTQFEEYDEMNVVMYWDSLEVFEVWRASDAFKAAHKRPSEGSGEPDPNSPVIKSQIIISEVAGSISK
ncbi:heme oxygenase [Solibacillus sp. FSL H8-0538]|uniref:heme oxygenase n=1 Tax=Solibacillus sp. FSL H8-0538 TaxID=2921400 RepID=UPI0030F8543F